MTGISTAVDSLYAIRELVFGKQLFSLEELVSCLRSNWGQNSEIIGLKLSSDRILEIRNLCMSQPKFGHGIKVVDQMAWDLINAFSECMEEVRNSPMYDAQWNDLRKRYGKDFEILIAPGVGTFEQYIFGGSFAGATPDGRPAFDPISSDLSPSPLFSDQDPFATTTPNGASINRTLLKDSLRSYADAAIEKLSDGAPSDFNIREDFPIGKLVEVLQDFADGKGSNVMTVTTGSPETYKLAAAHPDQYELVRVRMGGWTEFFITLFPNHKSQHQRRPIFFSQ
jgi:pyruvate-formate lyase